MTTPAELPQERAATARLLSLASHELRTPISVVSGYLRMLQRDESLTDRQRKMVDEAERACGRLVALATEISEVAKLDTGKAAPRTETLDLFAVIRKASTATDEGSDRGVRLELRGSDERAMIQGDRGQLEATVSVLLRAVLREQPDLAVVQVVCELRTDSARLAIGNSEQLRAANSLPQAPFDDLRGGLGLALPIARRVIEAHDGRIWSPAGTDGLAMARGAILVEIPTGQGLGIRD